MVTIPYIAASWELIFCWHFVKLHVMCIFNPARDRMGLGLPQARKGNRGPERESDLPEVTQRWSRYWASESRSSPSLLCSENADLMGVSQAEALKVTVRRGRWVPHEGEGPETQGRPSCWGCGENSRAQHGPRLGPGPLGAGLLDPMMTAVSIRHQSPDLPGQHALPVCAPGGGCSGSVAGRGLSPCYLEAPQKR